MVACSCCGLAGKNKTTCGRDGHPCRAGKCGRAASRGPSSSSSSSVPTSTCGCCGAPGKNVRSCGSGHTCRMRRCNAPGTSASAAALPGRVVLPTPSRRTAPSSVSSSSGSYSSYSDTYSYSDSSSYYSSDEAPSKTTSKAYERYLAHQGKDVPTGCLRKSPKRAAVVGGHRRHVLDLDVVVYAMGKTLGRKLSFGKFQTLRDILARADNFHPSTSTRANKKDLAAANHLIETDGRRMDRARLDAHQWAHLRAAREFVARNYGDIAVVSEPLASELRFLYQRVL